MKILFNPEDGAPIKDMVFNGPIFVSEDGDTFMPGSMVKVDDNVADFVMSTYGFIREVSEDEAKRIVEQQKNNKFKCDQCDYSTDTEQKLKGHKLSHARKAKIDKELGIKVITPQKIEEESGDRGQENIDAQAEAAGLEGEGLTIE